MRHTVISANCHLSKNSSCHIISGKPNIINCLQPPSDDLSRLTISQNSFLIPSNLTFLCKKGGKCSSKWKSFKKYKLLKMQSSKTTNKLPDRSLRSSSIKKKKYKKRILTNSKST